MKEALSVEDTLKLALEAIEFVHDTGDTQTFDMCYAKPALAAIKKALAQTQEPVAWGVFDDNLHDMFFAKEEAQEMVRLKGDGSTVKPLYTTPPQREFVGLTDEEIWETISRIGTSDSDVNPYAKLADARAIEAKLRSKNNG